MRLQQQQQSSCVFVPAYSLETKGMMASTQVVRYILAAEFLLGGQSRVGPALTPAVHDYVMSKAPSFYQNLTFIPGANAREKTQVTGAVMLVAAALLGLPKAYTTRAVRVGSVLLGGALSSVLWIGETSIGGQTWLPAINVGLAAWVIYKETTTNETA